MSYTGRQGGREIIFFNEKLVTAPEASLEKSFLPHWSKDPRFQLKLSESVVGSNPVLEIDLEHALISGSWAKLGTFQANADGMYVLYVESLETRFPFPLLRANIISMTDFTSTRLTLVGTGDRP